MQNIEWRNNALYLAIIAACGLFLLTQIYLGSFSRYIADDYCIASQVQTQGIIGTTVDQYNHWSGRFILITALGIVYKIGPEAASILPALLIIVWFSALCWVLHQLFAAMKIQRHWLAAAGGGSFITYAIFAGTPSVIQSLYWAAGSLSYTVSIPGLFLLLGMFVRTLRVNSEGQISPVRVIMFGIVAFMSGGWSETSAIFQIIMLVILFLGFVIYPRMPLKRQSLIILMTGIVFSVLVALLIVVAPGNTVRQSSFGETLPLLTLIQRILIVTASFIASVIGIFATVPLLISLVLTAIIVSRPPFSNLPIRVNKKQVRQLLLISFGTAILLVAACIAPTVYATHVAPPPRVYIFPYFVLICTAIFWGGLIGLSAHRSIPQNSAFPTMSKKNVLIVVAILLIGPVAGTVQVILTVPSFRTYANEWDARDRLIRTSGTQEIEVNTLPVDLGKLAGLQILDADPKGWVNQCVAQYYGVESISARELSQEQKSMLDGLNS